MERVLAELLVKASEHASGCGTEVRLYENYSGRGMYGDTTTGVVAPCTEDVLIYALKYFAYESQLTEAEIEAVEMLDAILIDNLGNDIILY